MAGTFLIESDVQMEYVLRSLQLAHGIHCAADDKVKHCTATAQHILGQILCARAEAAFNGRGDLGNLNVDRKDFI